MAKMIISENRLQELIQEGICEVLQESQYDESIGTLLGDGVRNAKKLPSKIKNSWNSFKNDFNTAKNNEPQDKQNVTGRPRSLAGLYGYAKERYWQKKKDWEDKVAAGGNYARYKYKDRDVVGDEYGQEMADNIRDYGTEPYRQDRLNNWRAQRGLGPQGVQPHPALAQQQQPNKLQQMRTQHQKNIETELYKAGLIKSGNGWKRKDGQANTPEDNALIDKWKRETMYENKKRLQSLINEANVLQNKLKKIK